EEDQVLVTLGPAEISRVEPTLTVAGRFQAGRGGVAVEERAPLALADEDRPLLVDAPVDVGAGRAAVPAGVAGDVLRGGPSAQMGDPAGLGGAVAGDRGRDREAADELAVGVEHRSH